MSKPEYGTIEYAKAHVGEWWVDKNGVRYKLMDVTELLTFIWRRGEEGGSTGWNDLSDWFDGNTRPESDPASVKRKVECQELWVLYDNTGGVVDYYTKEEGVDRNQILNTCIRHIPATTIEVEA